MQDIQSSLINCVSLHADMFAIFSWQKSQLEDEAFSRGLKLKFNESALVLRDMLRDELKGRFKYFNFSCNTWSLNVIVLKK